MINSAPNISLLEAPLMEYMTPNEAAERLRVSRTTIWRWVQAGRFDGVRRKGFGDTSPNMIPTDSVEEVARQLGLPSPDEDSEDA
jgi:excisionase family DNA binding protein